MHPPRARESSAAGTRSALLEAAAVRFGRYGYDGASVRDIARDAGVDAALVYRYFGSKDALFRLVSTNIALFDPLLEIPLEDVPAWICNFVTHCPQGRRRSAPCAVRPAFVESRGGGRSLP